MCNHTLIANETRRDPTRTLTVRNAFVRAMNRRFNTVAPLIRKAVDEEDVFGLREVTVNQTTPGRRRYQFSTSSEKVSQFMAWLRREVEQEILQVSVIETVGNSVNSAWTNTYVQDAYKKGVGAARAEVRRLDKSIPTIEATGGIQTTIQVPIHADRLGLLYTRVFNELKGVTDAMDQHISRVLAEGLAKGENPRKLANMLVSTMKDGGGELGINDILGRYIPAQRRAQMIARTEIIRAHAEGTLQEYRNWGVSGVNVRAEWITSGYRVCPDCEAKEGQTFTIEQATGMLPLHPNCRCSWIPVIV